MKTIELKDLGLTNLNFGDFEVINGGQCTSSWLGVCLCGVASATSEFLMAIPCGVGEGLQSGVNAWK